MKRHRFWFWPLGALIAVVPAVAILLLVLGATWQMVSWPYPRWAQTSAQWHQQFMWAGLVAGTVSCLWAVHLNGADRVWVQPQAPRLGAATVARHLAVLGGWLVGAYALALLPVTISTALHGGIGSPDVLVMLSGVLAMTAAVSLGYAVGTLVPKLIVVPVMAIALYALYVIGEVGADTYAAVSPILYLEPMLGQVESTELVLFRLLLFAAVTAAAAGLAATTLRRQATGMRSIPRSLGDVVASAAVPAVLVVLAVSNQPALFTVEDDIPRACRTVHGMEYCVHAADEPQLDAIVASFDPMLSRFGTTPDAFEAVWSQSLMLDEDFTGTPQNGVLTTMIGGDGAIDIAGTGFAESLVGFYTCMHSPEGADNGILFDVQNDLVAYLHGGQPSGAFAGMSDDEVRDWIAGHQDQLVGCELSDTDAPSA